MKKRAPAIASTAFYVTDGPLASTVSPADGTYFRECLAAGAGAVRVTFEDGSIDLISGSRYLEPGTRLHAEVTNGRLQIVYLGVTLREYDEWADFTDQLTAADYPLNA